MPGIGDRVRFESTKVGQVPRDGVVTAVDGALLHIEWLTGGESSLVPGAGSITIVGKVSGKTAAKRTTKKRAARKAAKKSAPAKKRTPARKAAKKSARSQEADPSPKGREEGCEETGTSSKAPCQEGG